MTAWNDAKEGAAAGPKHGQKLVGEWSMFLTRGANVKARRHKQREGLLDTRDGRFERENEGHVEVVTECTWRKWADEGKETTYN